MEVKLRQNLANKQKWISPLIFYTMKQKNKKLHHTSHHIFNSSLFEIMARVAQKLAYRATYLTDKNI